MVVTLAGLVGIELTLEAGVFLVEDEVDDTRDSVGSVGRRGTACDHFNALHQGLRNVVDVDHAGEDRSDRALTIDQHERTHRAKTTQVERIDASRTRTDARVGVLRRRTADDRRQGIHELGQVRYRRRLQFLDTDHRQRRRRFEAGALDTRTGNDDFIERIGNSGLLRYDGRRRQRYRSDERHGTTAPCHADALSRDDNLSDRVSDADSFN